MLKNCPGSNCFTPRNVLEVNSTMRAAGRDTMHYCFVWKKWQWLVSLSMEVNLCLNSGGCRVVRGGLSRGRWRRQAVYWELDQWQVNPLWRKPFIFVKAFLLQIHRGPDERLLISRCRGRRLLLMWKKFVLKIGEILKGQRGVCNYLYDFWIYFPHTFFFFYLLLINIFWRGLDIFIFFITD